MALPSIATLSPTSGPAVGLALVKITGTNFRLPDAQPATGPTQPRSPTVQVFFGTELALDVEVVSTTTLYIRTPAYLGPIVDGDLPAQDVTVKNLDNNGVPVVGEQATKTEAYLYKRPAFHGTPKDAPVNDGAYTLVSAGLVHLLQRQVLENVSLTTHVDYAEPGVITLNVSRLPAIVVQGPTVTNDQDYGHNEPSTIDNGDGTYSIKQPPDVKRCTFSIIGVSDNEREHINIIDSLQECFKVIKFLPVDKDSTNPTAGRVYPVLQMTSPPQTTSAPSDSNIRTFIAVCEVRGVEVFANQPTDHAFKVTDASLAVQELPSSTAETIEVS